ncbi:hypothetical protein K432DRAFT_173589 [Lepidopterella palustris CBS 459.81]|uniref:Uncharacterized protein n=1 Tax=Lepidopterella palustris CBS 459.81 TaxID=1314670 RepID=A0A8E2JI94_9PEZI|nr:hypothetical protein K432DRAFT_173589 [Lepidopterella palustris CBS 459.81]
MNCLLTLLFGSLQSRSLNTSCRPRIRSSSSVLRLFPGPETHRRLFRGRVACNHNQSLRDVLHSTKPASPLYRADPQASTILACQGRSGNLHLQLFPPRPRLDRGGILVFQPDKCQGICTSGEFLTIHLNFFGEMAIATWPIVTCGTIGSLGGSGPTDGSTCRKILALVFSFTHFIFSIVILSYCQLFAIERARKLPLPSRLRAFLFQFNANLSFSLVSILYFPFNHRLTRSHLDCRPASLHRIFRLILT